MRTTCELVVLCLSDVMLCGLTILAFWNEIPHVVLPFRQCKLIERSITCFGVSFYALAFPLVTLGIFDALNDEGDGRCPPAGRNQCQPVSQSYNMEFLASSFGTNLTITTTLCSEQNKKKGQGFMHTCSPIRWRLYKSSNHFPHFTVAAHPRWETAQTLQQSQHTVRIV